MATPIGSLIQSTSAFKGYTGSTGSTGYTGSIGTGYTGSASTVAGPIGYTGSAGFVGSASTVIGYTGSASTALGYTGSQGLLGYTGSVGFVGSQGVIGFTGSVGFVGSQGNIGYTGSTAYTTASNVQLNSLGIGTAASGVTGEIRATNEVTAYYTSDINLKENIIPISNALEKLNKIRGVMFDWKDGYIESKGGEDGYFIRKHDTGVIAQEVEAVLPEVVATRIDGSKAVKYEKMLGLVIQAINELSFELEEIKRKI